MIYFQLSIACLVILQVCGRTIDEAIVAAAKDVGVKVFEDTEGEEVRVELDILMKREDYMERQRKIMDERTGRRKRKAIMPESTRWPNNEIPYIYRPLTFSRRDREVISNAIAQWNNYTCLTFRPAKWNDFSKIRFQNSRGCSSYVGRIGGTQPVNLARGCRRVNIVIHELGHAAGFFHEQSRRDRDDFLEVLYENMIPGIERNFEIIPQEYISNYSVPYDYRSVMHYSGTAGSVNGNLVLRTLDPTFQDVIGNAPGLSFLDIKLANLMYNCNEDCPTDPCPDEGFQGQDCNCYCFNDNPEKPIMLCNGTDEVTEAPCEDKSLLCPSLRIACRLLPRIMNWNCPSTCSSCSMSGGPKPELIPCIDYDEQCDVLKSKGYCENQYDEYMKSNCALTCGFCKPVPPELYRKVEQLLEEN